MRGTGSRNKIYCSGVPRICSLVLLVKRVLRLCAALGKEKKVVWWDVRECLVTQLRREVGHTPADFRLLSSFDLGGLHYERILIIRAMRLFRNFVINTGVGARGGGIA
jgi:hypothetical protein